MTDKTQLTKQLAVMAQRIEQLEARTAPSPVENAFKKADEKLTTFFINRRARKLAQAERAEELDKRAEEIKKTLIPKNGVEV